MNKKKIENIERKISKMEYWDVPVLDLRFEELGSKIELYIMNNQKTCWKATFKNCGDVFYETDANWRGKFRVKELGPRSGYFAQDISVKEDLTHPNILSCYVDISIMTMDIQCEDISVELLETKTLSFFWENNPDQKIFLYKKPIIVKATYIGK